MPPQSCVQCRPGHRLTLADVGDAHRRNWQGLSVGTFSDPLLVRSLNIQSNFLIALSATLAENQAPAVLLSLQPYSQLMDPTSQESQEDVHEGLVLLPKAPLT